MNGLEENNEKSPKIPSIEERLSQLRPSRELLEYYRKKVAEFDDEHDEMLRRMEKYKISYEDQQKMELELAQREQEIVDLQKAISDLQVCVLQEREQVLRLYAENDRLKIREINDKKKIQHLLAIAGPAAAEVSYFHKEPPSKIVIPQVQPKSNAPNGDSRGVRRKKVTAPSCSGQAPGTSGTSSVSFVNSSDHHTLTLQVEALQAQLEEQAKLSRDQNNALLEERRILQEESVLARERDQERFDRYSERLKQAQGLLHESTQNILMLKRDFRKQEKEWLSEKDKLLQEMEHLREKMDFAEERRDRAAGGDAPMSRMYRTPTHNLASACVSDYALKQQYECEMKSLQEQLDQAGKLAEMYREQCIQAEEELARVREETDVHRDIFKERTDKMAKRLELMTVRYGTLEKRRGCEVEGFQTDIKNLRKRLKEVEKQLYKVTVGGVVSDAEVLQTVRATAGHSRAIQGELKNLKSKLYTLEGDLRGIY